jgi:hypothetical protein
MDGHAHFFVSNPYTIVTTVEDRPPKVNPPGGSVSEIAANRCRVVSASADPNTHDAGQNKRNSGNLSRTDVLFEKHL